MKSKVIQKITFAALIASLYFVLCLIEGYLASGPLVNIRLAEGLIIFALFIPETAIGVTLGCFLYNLFFGLGIIDASIGSAATILGSLCVLLIRKAVKKNWIKLVTYGIGLVVFNAVLVPIVLILGLPSLTWENYFYQMMVVGVGELIAVYGVGIPLYFSTKKFFIRNN